MTTLENNPTPGATPAPSQPAGTPGAPELAPGQTEHGGAPANTDGQAAAAPEGVQPQAPASTDPNEPSEPKWKGRFSDLSKAKTQAEIAAAEERGRRLALEDAMQRGLMQPREAQAPAPVEAPDPEPLSSQYKGGDFDPEYIKAWARWDNRQQTKALREDIRKEQEAAQRQAAERTEYDRGVERFNGAVQFCEQQAEATPNAAPMLRSLATPTQQGGVGLPNYLVDLITEDERPHVVAEYLAQNPQEIAAFRTDMRRGPAGLVRIADRIGQIKSHFAGAVRKPAAASPQTPTNGVNGGVPGVVTVPTPVNGTGGPTGFNPEAGAYADFDRHADAILAQKQRRFDPFNNPH